MSRYYRYGNTVLLQIAVIHEWTGRRAKETAKGRKLLAFCCDFRGQQGYSALPAAVVERAQLSPRDRQLHEHRDRVRVASTPVIPPDGCKTASYRER